MKITHPLEIGSARCPWFPVPSMRRGCVGTQPFGSFPYIKAYSSAVSDHGESLPPVDGTG